MQREITRQIVTIYCLCDDFLRASGVKDDPQARMTGAEVMTVALAAAALFDNNHERCRKFLGEHGYIPNMLCKSRLNRRLHGIDAGVWQGLLWTLAEAARLCEGEGVYAVDSAPVPVCDNMRISRCRLYRDEAFRGYCASKRRYYCASKRRYYCASKRRYYCASKRRYYCASKRRYYCASKRRYYYGLKRRYYCASKRRYYYGLKRRYYCASKRRYYCASKRRYYYGLKVHLLVSATGQPVEFVLTPASEGDVRGFRRLDVDLPEGSFVVADAAYTDYAYEDALGEEGTILIADRKSNSRRPHPPFLTYLCHAYRKRIETTFSTITGWFGRRLHAVTAKGFELKVGLSIVAYAIMCR